MKCGQPPCFNRDEYPRGGAVPLAPASRTAATLA